MNKTHLPESLYFVPKSILFVISSISRCRFFNIFYKKVVKFHQNSLQKNLFGI